MTLKRLIDRLLHESIIYRNSDKELIWRVWCEKGNVQGDRSVELITKDKFLMSYSPESIRRCRQALQRSDLLSGRNEIQATKKIKKYRDDEARLKGYNYTSDQGSFIL
mgnify:CR=1 FL=1